METRRTPDPNPLADLRFRLLTPLQPVPVCDIQDSSQRRQNSNSVRTMPPKRRSSRRSAAAPVNYAEVPTALSHDDGDETLVDERELLRTV